MASRATKGYEHEHEEDDGDNGSSSEPQEDDELTKGKLQFLDYDDDQKTTNDDGSSKMNAVSNGGTGGTGGTGGRPSKAAELRTSFLRAKEALATDRHYQITAALLLVILILSILLIYVSGKALAFALAGRSLAGVCLSGPCLHASGRLVTALNTSGPEPCEDFFSFACGGWRAAHPLDDNQPWYSVSDQLSEQVAEDLRRYLDQVLPSSSAASASDPHLKVKRFYESCMALEDIDVLSLNYFRHEIQKVGGWNVLGNWAGDDRNHVGVERLQTLYGVDAFFHIDIGADDLDPQLPYIIKISPGGLGLPKSYYFDPQFRSVVNAYKQYMSETVKIFGGTKLGSSQFAENTFGYEKRIAEITPDRTDYQTPSSVFKRRFSIRELKHIAPSIKWIDVLQRFFSKARLNDNTRVLLAFESYFRNVSNIISATDNRGLNDYLIWRMVSTYAPYLSKDFRLVHRNFRQALLGMPPSMLLDDTHRWRFCLETTSKFMGYGLASLYINGRIAALSNATVQARNDVVNSVRETVLKHSASLFDWHSVSSEGTANEEAARLVNMKLKAMEVLVGQPNFVMKTDRLVAYYNEFMVQVKFLENILEAVDHRHKKLEMLLSEKNVDTSWPVLPTEVTVSYDYAANKLYVPFGVLLPPFYSSSEPPVLQFGGLGVQVASQLLKAFDLVGLHYGLPDGRLSSNRSYASHDGFNRKLACLRDVLTGLQPESLKANETVSATYTDIGALKVAHLAFRDFIAKSGGADAVAQVLPSLRYTADQLFFISYSQTMCSNIRPAAAEFLTESSNQISDASVRVNAILAQSDAFREAFQCSERSSARPTAVANERRKQCSLWNS